jgi:hypothetical protein
MELPCDLHYARLCEGLPRAEIFHPLAYIAVIDLIATLLPQPEPTTAITVSSVSGSTVLRGGVTTGTETFGHVHAPFSRVLHPEATRLP